MTAAFAFSDKQDAKFPDACRAAMLVWGDIAKTIVGDEVGEGITFEEDGSVLLKYKTFTIALNADGSFQGKRITHSVTANEKKS